MEYVNDGRKWAAGQCQLSLDHPAMSRLWKDCALAAMSAWNRAGADFKFIEDPTSDNEIEPANRGNIGWLALTDARPTYHGANLTSAWVFVNLHYEWNPSSRTPHADMEGAYDLETVLAHELGHALHLSHDDSGVRSMMYARIGPGEKRVLHSNDVARFKDLYPAKEGASMRSPGVVSGMLAELDLPLLTRQAPLIVEGQVLGKGRTVTAPVGRKRQLVFTDHKVRVLAEFKNQMHRSFGGDNITVRVMGGQSEGSSTEVEGEATFLRGEDVILFLTKASIATEPIPPDVFTVLGGAQGKFAVTTRKGERFIERADVEKSVSWEEFRRTLAETRSSAGGSISA